jgi:uncharacterized protein (UPF0332 family)
MLKRFLETLLLALLTGAPAHGEQLRFEISNDPASHFTWVSGKSVSLGLLANESFQIGHPIVVKVALRNSSNSPRTFRDEPTFYIFRIYDSHGHEAKALQTLYGYNSNEHVFLTLAPGVAYTEDFDVTSQYSITSPGQYRVTVTRASYDATDVGAATLVARGVIVAN